MLKFEWESETQEKGFLNLRQWLRSHGMTSELTAEQFLIACYFIQKDHESHEWTMDMLGRVVGALQSDIKALQDKLDGLSGS